MPFFSGAPSEATGNGVDRTDIGFDIVVVAGQSNASGSGGPVLTDVFDVPDPRIWQYAGGGTYAGQIIRAVDPLENPEPDASSEVGPAMEFARRYALAIPTNRRILLVPTAIGGSALVGGPWAVGGAYYTQAISLANAAVEAAGDNARVVAILWVQGEGDAVAGRSQAQYAAALDAMIEGMRASIAGASSAPVFIGGMVPEWREAPNGSSLQIHAAHVSTPARVENAYFVDGPTGESEDTDGIHYTASGVRTLGARMAVAMLDAMKPPSVPDQVKGLLVSAGSGRLTLSWTKPSSSPAITDYLVEYRATGDTAWSQFSDGVSVALTAAITGLTNGVGYDVRVAAVNDLGTGAWSAVGSGTPAEVVLPSPSLLFDARSLSLSDGASVATWADESGNARDAVSAGQPPTYQAAGLNGHPCVSFNGSQWLQTSSLALTDVLGALGEYTVVAVAKSTTVQGAVLGLRSETVNGFHLGWTNSPATNTVEATTFSGINTPHTDTLTAAYGVARVLVMTRSASTVEAFVDGVTDGSTATTGSQTLTGSVPLTVGAAYYTGGSPLIRLTGSISYLAIYQEALDSEQRNVVEAALKAAFGTA